MTDTLLTPAQLGERLHLSEDQVLRLRRIHNWPCVQFNRKSVRFTEEQVAQIIDRHAADPKPAEEISLPAIAGQTKRSARRRLA